MSRFFGRLCHERKIPWLCYFLVVQLCSHSAIGRCDVNSTIAGSTTADRVAAG